MKRFLILLLDFTDWCLRKYINEPKLYKKGYFVDGIKFGVTSKK